MKLITSKLKEKKILVSDGAWGTCLQDKGLKPGECPELWCADHAEDILEIAKSYVSAGSDVIETNSFGGSTFKLEHYGLSNRTSELNEKAANISKTAVEDQSLVMASIGPTGKMLIIGDVTEEELFNGFKEQAIALEKGGADAICIETMTDIQEACLAIKAVKENTNLEIVCTFTFDKTMDGSYKTMMGVSPAEMAQAVITEGADIIGTNCGNGIKNMIDIVKEIRTIDKNIPILVHANAGLPMVQDGITVFPETPEEMAAQVVPLIEAGANIIGGCCGTTPEHISAIKRVVGEYLSR